MVAKGTTVVQGIDIDGKKKNSGKKNWHLKMIGLFKFKIEMPQISESPLTLSIIFQ